MYFITFFGLLLGCFCLYMIIRPDRFAESIIRFGEKGWFHYFEIISRFIAGILFIYYSSVSLYPVIFTVIGCVLLAVALGLILIGEKTHKAFAFWAANTFRNKFRLFGILSFPAAIWLVYATLFSAIT